MKRSRTLRQQAWASSARFREIGIAALRAIARKRAKLPKCGATARTTGEPCRQPAMENGRCRYHGGATPRGDAWHRPLWPDRNSPRVNEKLARKLAQLERASRKRAERLRAMSPDERAAHDLWQRAHSVGSAAARKMKRKERLDTASLRASRENARHAPDPELLALERDIARLRARIAREQAEADNEGVLG